MSAALDARLEPVRRPAPLGEWLLRKGLLTRDQLQVALIEQKLGGERLGSVLMRLGFVSEPVLRECLSERFGHRHVDLAQTLVDARAIALVPKDLARRYHLLPIAYREAERTLLLAMANPDNLLAVDQVNALLPAATTIEVLLASEAEILTAIDRCYGLGLSVEAVLRELDGSAPAATGGAAGKGAEPVVRLIDAVLADAVMREASDIHFEPEQHFIRIRYRVDGVLHQAHCLHGMYWSAMAVRLKIMAGLDIAESRSPQDGRLGLNLFGRPIDFRLATHPTTAGENIVLRILDRQKALLPLDRLDLSEAALQRLSRILSRPEGLVLVSGPTGSGKTTTLYALLGRLNRVDVNIMTLEDPVEYPLPLLRQTDLCEANKIDFVNGVRSILRQDPDVILIGEIRDRETAEMALRAAMTGHRVFATLHASAALGVPARLRDMGVAADVMSGTIAGIVGQRLLRTLCPRCRVAYAPDERERRLLGVAPSETITVYRAGACAFCRHSGYKGRTPVLEILPVDEALDAHIAGASARTGLARAAYAAGFRPLVEEAIDRVREGCTSIEELRRVIDLSGRDL